MQLVNGDTLTGGTLEIGLAQTDTSRLELTGNNTVSCAITIFPRAFGQNNNPYNLINPANIDNLSGTNTVSPPSAIVVPTGGNLLTLQSDSGYLIFNAGVFRRGGRPDHSRLWRFAQRLYAGDGHMDPEWFEQHHRHNDHQQWHAGG